MLIPTYTVHTFDSLPGSPPTIIETSKIGKVAIPATWGDRAIINILRCFGYLPWNTYLHTTKDIPPHGLKCVILHVGNTIAINLEGSLAIELRPSIHTELPPTLLTPRPTIPITQPALMGDRAHLFPDSSLE